MEEYLTETLTIDYTSPIIQEKVHKLKNQSTGDADYIKRSFNFVRDEIPHSWDIQTDTVSKTASEALLNKTGICWVKSCLFAALLRANKIPSGISYQLLTRAHDESEGYIIHALNTVYIKDLKKWIRLDTREKEENISFALDKEILAYNVRKELGEIDYEDNHPDLDKRLVKILKESENIADIKAAFEF